MENNISEIIEAELSKIISEKYGDFSDNLNIPKKLTPLEKEILKELTSIENQENPDLGSENTLILLKKIKKLENQENGIDYTLLIKIKWYLKFLLYHNFPYGRITEFIENNLIHLLDNKELNSGRSLESPLMVGFNRDDSGKIIPIYGNKIFHSKRNVEGTILIGHNSKKEVVLIPSETTKVDESSLKKSKYWHLLPKKLREIFENSEILQTTNIDLYNLNNDYHNDSLKQENQEKTLSRLDENIIRGSITEQIKNDATNYMFLYYGGYRDDSNGRVGVLVEVKNGNLKPVTVNINGKEYIIEIKGCGLRTGGFKEMDINKERTGRKILEGACEKEQALKEFNSLNEIENGDGPKIAGVSLFNNNGYEQGQIIRLSPSTIRASYTGNKCYKDIETIKNVKEIIDKYIEGFINMLFENPPRIIDESAHTENLLLWGKNNFCWTDFSDQLSLNSNSLPYKGEKIGWGFIGVKKLLYFIIRMKKEIPGYEDKKLKKYFIGKLKNTLSSLGVEISIDISSSDEQITNEIWEKFLAYSTFKQKIENGYFPNKIKKSFEKEKEKFLAQHNSSYDFQDKLKGIISELINYLEEILKSDKYDGLKDEIENTLSNLKSGNIKKDFLEKSFKIFFGVDKKIVKLLSKLFECFFDLKDIVLFLEGEKDMLENAKKLANNNEIEIIDKGIKFYNEKLNYIKKVSNFELPLDEIYDFMINFKFESLVFE